MAQFGLTVLSDSSSCQIYWSSVETLFLLFSMSMWTTTVAAWSRRRLVDVCCGFFPSRLLRSSPALRTRRKHADVPCLPLVSATARAYYQIHVLPDMRRQGLAPSLCRFGFLTRCLCVQRWLPEGLAGSAKRLKRRSRRAKDHSASSARGSRERRSGSTEWCSVRNRLPARPSCVLS